jgi:hypothetical protein
MTPRDLRKYIQQLEATIKAAKTLEKLMGNVGISRLEAIDDGDVVVASTANGSLDLVSSTRTKSRSKPPRAARSVGVWKAKSNKARQFGSALRHWRESNNLSLKQAGERMGIDPIFLSSLQSGKKYTVTERTIAAFRKVDPKAVKEILGE